MNISVLKISKVVACFSDNLQFLTQKFSQKTAPNQLF